MTIINFHTLVSIHLPFISLQPHHQHPTKPCRKHVCLSEIYHGILRMRVCAMLSLNMALSLMPRSSLIVIVVVVVVSALLLMKLLIWHIMLKIVCMVQAWMEGRFALKSLQVLVIDLALDHRSHISISFSPLSQSNIISFLCLSLYTHAPPPHHISVVFKHRTCILLMLLFDVVDAFVPFLSCLAFCA